METIMQADRSKKMVKSDAPYVFMVAGALILVVILYLIDHHHPAPVQFGLDKLMHLLGGFIAPLVLLFPFQARRYGILRLLLLAFGVGYAWEILEDICPWMTDGVHSMTSMDTFGDLTFDTVGGAVAWLWYRHWFMRYHN